MDTFTLTGDNLTRAVDALMVARHQVRLAQHAADSWRLEDALADIEDALVLDLRLIRDAMDDDAAEAEYSGDSEALRQTWRPVYKSA